MEILTLVIDCASPADRHLGRIIRSYGIGAYLMLLIIIFCETGLVATLLPHGDSLLVATGSFAAAGSLDLLWLIILLSISAIPVDTMNYWIGAYRKPKVFYRESVHFIKKGCLNRTGRVYDKYGGKTVIVAPFVPIMQTFAPFIAGIGTMTCWKFTSYNIVGEIAWVVIGTLAGHFFDGFQMVRNNLSLVILAIIIISVLPGIIGFKRQRYASRKAISI